MPIRRYDFVKMDVEGAEWLVLQGAGPLFKEYRPTLMIEFNEGQLRALSKISLRSRWRANCCRMATARTTSGAMAACCAWTRRSKTLREMLEKTGVVNLVFMAS